MVEHKEEDRRSWDKGKQAKWGPRRAKRTPDLHSRSRKPVTMPKFQCLNSERTKDD